MWLMMEPDKIDEIIAENPEVWKTRAAFFSYIKGIIRKGWSKHPVRTNLLKKRTVQVENTNPRSMKRFPMVAACVCENCGELVKKALVEVDHTSEVPASLVKIEDIQSCAEALLLVCEKDLQVLCKPCHSTITLARDRGISFEEAVVEKQVIAFEKLKAAAQTKLLTELQIESKMLNNAKARAEAYRNYLKEIK